MPAPMNESQYSADTTYASTILCVQVRTRRICDGLDAVLGVFLQIILST